MHELVASEVPKAYLFRGTKETTAQDVAKMLGLGQVQFKRPAGMPGPSGGAAGIGRFLLPYSDCDYTLESIIDDLQVMQLLVITPHMSRCQMHGIKPTASFFCSALSPCDPCSSSQIGIAVIVSILPDNCLTTPCLQQNLLVSCLC